MCCSRWVSGTVGACERDAKYSTRMSALSEMSANVSLLLTRGGIDSLFLFPYMSLDMFQNCLFDRVGLSIFSASFVLCSTFADSIHFLV